MYQNRQNPLIIFQSRAALQSDLKQIIETAQNHIEQTHFLNVDVTTPKPEPKDPTAPEGVHPKHAHTHAIKLSHAKECKK